MDGDMPSFCMTRPSDTFTPYGKDSSFGKNVCYQRHTLDILVKDRDYIFTSYPLR
jgi:hypothetical protein